MKRTINWVFAVVLLVLLPVYITGAGWVLGTEIISWTLQNLPLAAVIVVLVYQNHRINHLEQETQWLRKEQMDFQKANFRQNSDGHTTIHE